MLGSLIALVMSSAWADGGRIDFTGAVVEPTCAAPAESAALATGQLPPSHSFVCGGRPQATDDPGASSYVLSVEHLDAAATAGSPLLQYFAGYRAAAHAADAQMLTRTYE